MINTDMKLYNFFTLGEKDAYGQEFIPTKDSDPKGTVKMSINTTSQAIQDNIRYKDCSYIGLTHALVDDTYVIDYNGELLKVLYVNPKGRLKQVFMKNL